MYPKIKILLICSALIALFPIIAWHLYKYRNKLEQRSLLASYAPMFGPRNTGWIEKYLAPGHSLNLSSKIYTIKENPPFISWLRNYLSPGSFGDLHLEGYRTERLYPFMDLMNSDGSKMNVDDMTASEILLQRCFKNFQDNDFPYTLEECIGTICYRLYYLELLHALMKRYALYLEIEFGENGEFEIHNKLPYAGEAEEHPGTVWYLKNAKYEEVAYAIGMMDSCKRIISTNTNSRRENEDIVRGCEDINSAIEKLNGLTSQTHRFTTTHFTPPNYHEPKYLSKTKVNDVLLKQLRDGTLSELQPTIESETHHLYETDYALRDLDVGQRKAREGEENSFASKSTYNSSAVDKPSSETNAASRSLYRHLLARS